MRTESNSTPPAVALMPPRSRVSHVVGAFLLSIALTALEAKPVAPATLAGIGPLPAGAEATAEAELHALPLGLAQFDTSFTPPPLNVPSLGFAATATSEFGDLVRLEGAGHYIDSIVVTMSSWAIRSDYAGGLPFGFTHPVTLTLYAVDTSGGVPRPGAVLAQLEQNFLIPWRPEPDPSSTSPLRPWRGADGAYYTGLAFNVAFDLGPLGVALPTEVIATISFNTQHHGPEPLGVPGPYDALHVALSEHAPERGADVEPGAVFWNTARAEHYSDASAAELAGLRRDSGWAAYKPALRFTNSPFGTIVDSAAALALARTPNAQHEAALRNAATLTSQAQLRGLWDGNNRLTTDYGRLVFGLIAEAVSVLAPVAQTRDPAADVARTSIQALLTAAAGLAETALGDAIIAGGNGRRISRSQHALDTGQRNEARQRYDRAVDRYGAAWREAHTALWD